MASTKWRVRTTEEAAMQLFGRVVALGLVVWATWAGARLLMGPPDAARAQSGCGGPRWLVKTLGDPDAARVDFAPVAASIAELVALPAPPPEAVVQAEETRFTPVELTTYTLTARVAAARLMSDGDLRLVLANPQDPNETMIAELPDVINCPVGAAPELRDQMAAAREAFLTAFGTPPTAEQALLDAPIEITGVGFFGPGGRLPGIAANRIELHPVLALRPLP